MFIGAALIVYEGLETLSERDRDAINCVFTIYSAAPARQRNLILEGILSQCCSPQLRYLNDTVPRLIRVDFLDDLPEELSFKVLCFLDTASLCKAAQVSTNWRRLADDDVVWHRMCEQHIDRKCTKCGWGLPLLERKQLRASKRQMQLRATGRENNESSRSTTPYSEMALPALQGQISRTHIQNSPNIKGSLWSYSQMAKPEETASDSNVLAVARSFLRNSCSESNSKTEVKTRPWKDVYKDRFLVGANWKYGRCALRIFKGHSDSVMALQFDSSILVTGSHDSTIKVWDIVSGKEIRTLKGHSRGIRCLQFDVGLQLNEYICTNPIDDSGRIRN